MLNQQYTNLERIDSFIEPLLKRVVEAHKLGIWCETIQVESTSSSCNKTEGDRFKLSIPYAKQTLTWNVLFDSQCPQLGPDFIFNDDNFLLDMNIDTLCATVPSLAKWNVNDKEALLNVLMELLSCYKQYQIQLLQKQERLKMEYGMLMSSMEITQEDVEVILLPFGSRPTEIIFLISLSIDVSQCENQTLKSENDKVMLLVTFYGPNWTRTTSQIFLSKYIEQVFDGTSSLQLTHYPAEKLLIDYVVEIKKNIEEKTRLLVQSSEKRRLFVSTIKALRNGSVIEYDSTKFSSVVILLEQNDFTFVVHIRLPLNFPLSKPIIIMQSVYHMTKCRRMYEEKVENFNYSAVWTPLDMIQEIWSTLDTRIDKFKHNSIQKCS